MTRRTDYYRPGDWNAICFECGRKRKASELRKHWQGYYVCPEHFEPRHPQDFVRATPDIQTPRWTQPRQTDVFIADAPILVEETSDIPAGNLFYILAEDGSLLTEEA